MVTATKKVRPELIDPDESLIDEDLKEAAAGGLLLLPCPGTNAVRSAGRTGRVIEYDPEMPVETRAPRIRKILSQIL